MVLQANTVALLGNTEPAFISDKQHKLLPNKWHIPENIQYMYIHWLLYLTIRLQARVVYEQIVNEVQPSWLLLVENEGH